ncbi:type 1 glutamine amidotransferase domain-containing protein [Streptococcus sp. 20-1249]|uniref:type 1 glutamine amidotransferase domain-containing protein n=1 Tax=Streptococcus hepaticus TaxID=3349163 RepID=UPI003747D48B
MKPIVMVATNQEQYEGHNLPTGLWLGEITHFYHVMKKLGIPLQLASLKGGKIPLDPLSVQEQFMDEATKPYYQDSTFMQQLENSPRLADLHSDDFSAIYFAGGHGAMYDFTRDAQVASWILQMLEADKFVAAVCHGVAALIHPDLAEVKFLDGKTITGYTNVEEAYVQHTDHVPFLLESRLQELGGNFLQVAPFQSHVQVSGHLITGQNPQSTLALAETVAELLEKNER